MKRIHKDAVINCDNVCAVKRSYTKTTYTNGRPNDTKAFILLIKMIGGHNIDLEYDSECDLDQAFSRLIDGDYPDIYTNDRSKTQL